MLLNLKFIEPLKLCAFLMHWIKICRYQFIEPLKFCGFLMHWIKMFRYQFIEPLSPAYYYSVPGDLWLADYTSSFPMMKSPSHAIWANAISHCMVVPDCPMASRDKDMVWLVRIQPTRILMAHSAGWMKINPRHLFCHLEYLSWKRGHPAKRALPAMLTHGR